MLIKANLIRSCIVMAAVALVTAIAQGSDRPNIILIMPDDQGYGDQGFTGNPVIRTPNLDALAAQSASLTDFYVCPVCSPTRASLMTGRYHYRTRVVDTFQGGSMMDPDETTIAEILHDAGYRTGLFGKWHLGDNYPMRPQDQGFDEVYMHRGGGLGQASEPIENNRRYTNPILFHNGQQIQTEGYCTDLYFEQAMRFIDQCQQDDKPFFVYLPPNAPHAPLHDVPEELYAYYKSIDLTPILNGKPKQADNVARIAAMIENIDANVGRLRRHLVQRDLADNTIIVFMVDNGPNSPRYVGPFRGMKTDVYEGGIRSPFLIHWPGNLKPSASSDRITAHIDVMPTLLDAVQVELPEGLKIDGRSVLPLLQGSDALWPDRTLFLQVHRGSIPIENHHVAVRSERWKLVHPTGFGRYEMPANVPLELYDMRQLQSEQRNVATQHPEVVDQLSQAYRDWFKDVSTTRPDNYAAPRIILGHAKEPESVLTAQDWQTENKRGWGQGGYWLVDVVGEREFAVEVIYKESISDANVTILLDSKPVANLSNASGDRIEFETVALAAGPASLQVETVTGSGKQIDPYHVILKTK